MFGNRDLVEKVTAQATELEVLRRENERLTRRQLGSNVATFADAFDARMTEWADGGYQPHDLDSDVTGVDRILDDALRAGAEAQVNSTL